MRSEMRLTVRLSALMGMRVKVRADSMRLSSAEYLRALIENDLKKGRVADALAKLNTEVTLVTAMMVRELAAYVLGTARGKSLESWANGRAETIVQETLREREWGA